MKVKGRTEVELTDGDKNVAATLDELRTAALVELGLLSARRLELEAELAPKERAAYVRLADATQRTRALGNEIAKREGIDTKKEQWLLDAGARTFKRA